MKQQSNKIECPHCGEEIDVNEILYHQLDEELKKKYNSDLASERKKYQEKQESLDEQRESFEKEKQEQEKTISVRIKKELLGREEQLKNSHAGGGHSGRLYSNAYRPGIRKKIHAKYLEEERKTDS